MSSQIILRLGSKAPATYRKVFPITRRKLDLLQQQPRPLHTSNKSRKTFEPDYLDAAGLIPTVHNRLNIQVKGYDFDVLESYQSYIHNLAENIGIDVGDAWATPCTSFAAHTYAPQSTKVSSSFSMNLYERNVQIVDVQTTDLPVLIDALRKTLPEGVSLSVHEHQEEHYEARYIPDPLINEVRDELNVIETERAEAIAQKRAERLAKGKKA